MLNPCLVKDTFFLPDNTPVLSLRTSACCQGGQGRVVGEDKLCRLGAQILEAENCRERGLGTYMNKAVVLA